MTPGFFPGREFDSETGLYYFRARFYDPTLGRFVEIDPTGFDAGDPNFYRYVVNSPVNFTDPSGLESLQAPQRPAPEIVFPLHGRCMLPPTAENAPPNYHGPLMPTRMEQLKSIQWQLHLKEYMERSMKEKRELGLWVYVDRSGVVYAAKVDSPRFQVHPLYGGAIFFGPKPKDPENMKLIMMIHTHPTRDVQQAHPMRSPTDVPNQPNYQVPWLVISPVGSWIISEGNVTPFPFPELPRS